MNDRKTGTDKLLRTLAQNLKGVPPQAAVFRYLEWINREVEEQDILFLREYLPILRANKKDDTIFLSVVTRTQGKRPEMLRDTLKSLVEQTDTAFELLIVGHKMTPQQRTVVQQIISEQPDSLRERIRLIELNRGNATAPSNFGFAHARGEYVTLLDDDDTVRPYWVEKFHQAARQTPGVVLHAYVMSQAWSALPTPDGGLNLQPAGPLLREYCTDFALLQQLRGNRCPLMGLAFPAYVFHQLGFHYDETLSTMEDWDFLMRVASLVGVEDIQIATSLYRKWTNADNSSTIHSPQEWQSNYLAIQDKFTRMPLLIPANQQKSALKEGLYAAELDGLSCRAPKIETPTLYLNRGAGFLQTDALCTAGLFNGTAFDASFRPDGSNPEPVCEIRLDLCEEGMFAVDSLLGVLTYSDGSSVHLTPKECQTNGAKCGDSICFLQTDPWMIWPVDPTKQLQSIRFIGEVRCQFSNAEISAACTHYGTPSFQLFYTRQPGSFCEENSVRRQPHCNAFEMEFALPQDSPPCEFRLDPGEETNCVLHDFHISMRLADGGSAEVAPDAVRTNGVKTDRDITFSCPDPQLCWDSGDQPVCAIQLSGIFYRLP